MIAIEQITTSSGLIARQVGCTYPNLASCIARMVAHYPVAALGKTTTEDVLAGPSELSQHLLAAELYLASFAPGHQGQICIRSVNVRIVWRRVPAGLLAIAWTRQPDDSARSFDKSIARNMRALTRLASKG